MFLATDLDDALIQMPLVIGTRMIAPDSTREMPTKLIDPKSDGLAADHHAPLSQKVFNVSCVQREAMVRPKRHKL